MDPRIALKLCSLLAGLGIALPAVSATSTPRAGAAPTRIVVKLQPALARSVASELDAAGSSLARGETPGSAADAFLARHSLRGLRPLFAGLAKALRRSGISERQWAERQRQRFAARAARHRGAFNPPELSRSYVVDLETSTRPELDRALASLSADPLVEYAEEDHLVSLSYEPNDPYFGSSGSWGQAYDDLWGVKTINAPAAWDTSRGAGVVVAIVDTGLDSSHPDIAANVWTNAGEIAANGIDDDGNGFVDDIHGWDAAGADLWAGIQPDNDPADYYGHGTHVAGTVAAVGDNGLGVVGVAWQARVMAFKGFDDWGWAMDSTLADGIRYAADNGADIINASWGGAGSSQTIADVISYAHSLGVTVVAAAGNDDADVLQFYPAALSDVIAVAASSPSDSRTSFSNWGTRIDVAAPGQSILSLRAAGTRMGRALDDRHTVASGTSMAAPHVAGLAALILAQHPDYSNEQVRQVLRVSATDIEGDGVDLASGYGRIDAAGALGVSQPLEAHIAGPAPGTHAAGAVDITGFARGAGFVGYALEYGVGETPDAWTPIAQGASPVDGGTLGVFDAGLAPDGPITVRLTVTNAAGLAFEDRLLLVVDYVKITSPKPPHVWSVAAWLKPGTPIAIAGTAQGPSFSGFRIEWAAGINPDTGWVTDGVTLAGGGATPVVDGGLGTWDTVSDFQAGYYTIRLVVANADFSSEARTLVYLEPDLLTHYWPRWLEVSSSPLAGALPSRGATGQTRLRLATRPDSGIGSKLRSFSADGAVLTEVGLDQRASEHQLAVADLLAASQGEETVVAQYDSVRVFRSNDTSYALPVSVPSPMDIQFSNSQALIEDLDGDGSYEILANAESYRREETYILAWRATGEPLGGNFPLALHNATAFPYESGHRFLVVDLDGNGTKEIVAAEWTGNGSFGLRLFGSDGSPQAWATPDFEGELVRILAADLDRDGRTEILVLEEREWPPDSSEAPANLHVIEPDGSERPGWPVAVVPWLPVVVGDVDGNGRDEIVTASPAGWLTVLRSDGTPASPAWPSETLQWLDGATLADVNGDGLPEILAYEERINSVPDPLTPPGQASALSVPGRGPRVEAVVGKEGTVQWRAADTPRAAVGQQRVLTTRLLAVRQDGTIDRSWELLGLNGDQPTNYGPSTTVGDFNDDGRLDIAVTYTLIAGGGISGWLVDGVLAVLTTGTPYVARDQHWPSVHHDTRDTAVRNARMEGPPSVWISDASVVEGPDDTAANATFTVSLSWPSPSATTLNWATANGTATAGSDYVARSGAVSFAPGVTVMRVRVGVLGDALSEPDETFLVNLSAPSPSGVTIGDGQGVGTIRTDDVGMSIADVTITEGDSGTSNAEIPVTLASPSTLPVTVHYATVAETAASGVDFTPVSGDLTLEPGVTTQVIAVPVIGDTLYETDETFLVNLTSATNAVFADRWGRVTILDRDQAPTISITGVSVIEGAANTSVVATFTVSLSAAAGQGVTVAYATADGTAAAGADYGARSGTLSFAPGVTVMTVRVPVLGDALSEPDETFLVNLSAPSPSGVTIGDGQGVGTIRTDDVGMSIADVTITEGDSGTSNVEIPVTLTWPSTLPVTVHYATVAETATSGIDFTPVSGDLTFEPGVTTQVIAVPVIGDTLYETDETFLVNLTSATNAVFADKWGRVTILDRDQAPTISITDASAIEGVAGTGVYATFTVSLSAAAGQGVTVAYATADGTATAGSDYVARSGTVSFAPGVTVMTVRVGVLGDALSEPDETFVVNLSAASPSAVTIVDGQAVGTIRTDDVGMSIADVTITEGDSGTSNAEIPVTLASPSTLPVTVHYATVAETATSGVDFTPVSGDLTFEPGVTTQVVTVPVIGDTLYETDETFLVNLSAPTNAAFADRQARVTILDGDQAPTISAVSSDGGAPIAPGGARGSR